MSESQVAFLYDEIRDKCMQRSLEFSICMVDIGSAYDTEKTS